MNTVNRQVVEFWSQNSALWIAAQVPDAIDLCDWEAAHIGKLFPVEMSKQAEELLHGYAPDHAEIVIPPYDRLHVFVEVAKIM